MQRVMATDFDFVEENGQRIYQLMGNVAEYTSDTRDSEGDITCKSGPPGDCKRVSDCATGDVDCQQNALSCPACATAVDPCYYMCDATEDPASKRQTIVCTAYPEGEQPIAASMLASTTTGSRVVRGGNITVKSNDDACQLTSTFRDKVQDPSTPSPTVGFRCAKTL
jgi:formylglycine-generating enzyme required for sulfatase activity